MLKVHQMTIKGINGVENLNLKFNSGVNFISGRNGVGKTTILDCIASSFNRHKSNVRRKVNVKECYWNILVEKDNSEQFREFYIDYYGDDKSSNRIIKYKNSLKSRKLINFTIQRTSPTKLFYMNQLDSIQSWIYRNYYEDNTISENKYNNIRVIQKCFNKIDPDIYYSRVEKREINKPQNKNNKRIHADIYVKTPQGEIPIDYLSSGYKSCLVVLLGIIKQAEMTGALGDIHNFNGVILIDELDLHLHPEWQGKLIELMKWLVPEAQIIATTHSPHIIQMAEPGEIIPLGIEDFNGVFIRDLPDSSRYGFQGWTIEEILTEVMGLSITRSKVFNEYLDTFYRALYNGEFKEIKTTYKELSSMIHPSNPLAKILRIQAGEYSLWEEIKNDSTF